MAKDTYNIEENFNKLKKLITEKDSYYGVNMDSDMFTFLYRERGGDASIRLRHKLNEIRKLSEQLRRDILKQRQDNKSDYSEKK